MEIPVIEPPAIINELIANYGHAFPEIRQFRHFSEYMAAMNVSDKKSIAHLNSLIPDHANQSSMNRFLSSKMDTNMIFNTTAKLINPIEKDGILAIDGTIVEKAGKYIEGTSWLFDHSIGKNVFGMQLATSVFSGEYGIYPISADVYRRLGALKKENRESEYKTKIEMQIGTIGKCLSAGLNFHTVAGDVWYFTKALVKYLNSQELDWVFQSKSNRKIKIGGRWTTLDLIPLSYPDSTTVRISGNTYSVWVKEGNVRGIGNARIVISEGINGKRYCVTGRMDWDLKRILATYLRRWDIEVLHRDLKQDGLGHIFLRKLCRTELYLRLIVAGRVLLEISSIRSLSRYRATKPVGKRKRWLAVESLKSLAGILKKYGKRFIDAIETSIMNPYRSARKIFKAIYNQDRI